MPFQGVVHSLKAKEFNTSGQLGDVKNDLRDQMLFLRELIMQAINAYTVKNSGMAKQD